MNKRLTSALFAIGLFLVNSLSAMQTPPQAQKLLLQATDEANITMLKKAVDEGADINALSADPSRMTVLHRFVDTKKPFTEKERTFFEILLDVPNINVNIPSGTGETSLHIAAKNRNRNAIEKLLKKGANIDLEDYMKRTPLHAAAYGGSSEIVKLLLDKGAITTIEDREGNRAFHILIERSKDHDPSIVKEFADRGTDINAPNKKGETPLHIASGKDYRFTEALIKSLKKDKLNTTDAEGRTALLRAITFNIRPRIVKLLLEAGIDPNKSDTNLRTAFHNLAVAMSDYEATMKHIPKSTIEELKPFEEVAELLLNYKADPTTPDKDGKTALDLAQGEYIKAYLTKAIESH